MTENAFVTQINHYHRFECYFPDFLKIKIYHYPIIILLCLIFYSAIKEVVPISWIVFLAIFVVIVLGILAVALMKYMARGYMEIDENYIHFDRSFKSFTLPKAPIGGLDNALIIIFQPCTLAFVSLQKIVHNRCFYNMSSTYYEEFTFYYKNGEELQINFSLDKKGYDNQILRQQLVAVLKKYCAIHQVELEQIEKDQNELFKDELEQGFNPKPTTKAKDTFAFVLTLIAMICFLPLIILVIYLLLSQKITFTLIVSALFVFISFALLCRVLYSRIVVLRQHKKLS